ncbi:MAG TPA: AraC family transcriptional regulator [Streptomyces sp.]|uniref:helix-turn-helix domain-containing protein n=1 Tax=Streptomyces sp. TaxID=1931 RepID=UPI002B69279F|nr:AraC family transcriptional regulator [Streptomyces sp.]HWU08677.1 AraC family transcriptional regulator [Streptomyces sp.]
MKENGQIAAGSGAAGIAAERSAASIPTVAYRPAPGRPPGLEVLGLPEFTARAAERGRPLDAPGRPAFHVVLAMRGGRLACSVDFTSYLLHPGDWLWVWPGQVLQLPDGAGECDATVLVFPTGFPNATTDALIRDAEHVPYRLVTPDAPRQTALLRLLDALVEEHACLTDLSLEAYIETLRGLLSVILIRLVHLADPRRQTRSGRSEPFHLFRRAVEEGFGRTHRVEDYAAELGYSPRTLTRATRAALGVGAKRYIDDRVLLEAKRLLIHTLLPPAAISERVGFTYPTVFSAFFRQHTGMTPTEFRRATRT